MSTLTPHKLEDLPDDIDDERLLPTIRVTSKSWRTWRRRAIVLALVFGAMAMVWFGTDQLSYLHKVNPPGDPLAADVFEVAPDDDLDAVSEKLETAGFIVDAGMFVRYVGEEGGLVPIPGFYTIRPRDHMGNILAVLRTPPNETYFKITFPEGFTTRQIAERIASEVGSINVDGFVTAAGLATNSSSVRSKYQPEGSTSLEGLLFPDTYLIAGDSTPDQVLREMVSLMERVGTQEGLDEASVLVGRSPYEVLIVASIIEREAKLDEDRDLIARVIYNRLDKGMPLEVDATLFYGQDPDTPFAELKAMDTPYNTYLHVGLPPTPIANPGRASIAAALDPAPNPSISDPRCAEITDPGECRYFYYVLADEEGRHVFAVTLDQHLANVQAAIESGVL